MHVFKSLIDILIFLTAKDFDFSSLFLHSKTSTSMSIFLIFFWHWNWIQFIDTVSLFFFFFILIVPFGFFPIDFLSLYSKILLVNFFIDYFLTQ